MQSPHGTREDALQRPGIIRSGGLRHGQMGGRLGHLGNLTMLLYAVFRHRGTAHLARAQGVLKAALRGGNGGILTSLAVVAGVAGAQSAGAAGLGVLAIVVLGLASLAANAVWIGLGGFVSDRAQRHHYRGERHRMMERMGEDPRRGREAVEAVLVDGGLDEDSARDAAAILIRSPDMASDLILSREFGLSLPRATNPALDALAAFGAFVGLGMVPLLPYLLGVAERSAFGVSVTLTALALLLTGGLRWHATGESPLRALGETLLFGGLIAVVAHGVGRLVAG